MNKLNNKEEEIKDILGGLEIDIDTNDIWANIESELPQPKKKRRLGMLFLIGIIGLSVVGLILKLSNATHANMESDAINISTTTTSDQIVAIAKHETTNTETITKENIDSKTQENVLSDSKSIKATSPHTNTVQIKSNSIDIQNKVKNNTSPFTEIRKESNPVVSFKILESDNTNTDAILNETSILNTHTELLVQETRTILSEVNRTTTLSSELLEIAQRQRIESSPSLISPLHNNGRKLILQFKLGANQNSTSISNINSVGEFDASEFDFERDRLGFSGTFNIGVENNGWRFLAGASYHHHVSSYERDDVQIVTDLVSGIESYKISSDGITTAQNGTVLVTSARDNEISYHRQHRAIDFHISLGKRLWSYKGLVLMADAGFGVNTITNSSGYFLADKDFGFTKIYDGNNPYKLNTHWNAIASLELGYDLGNTRIGLSPFIRYNPNSITSQTHLYTLKNSQVGMQLSLTYTPTRE